MVFPKLPYSLSRSQMETVQFVGINYSDNYAEGALAESKNLSARRYPYITARRARNKLEEYSGASALTSWEKLVTVKDNKLYYGDVECGELAPGEKQFAVINTKLVIFPDKKYVDLSAAVLKPSEKKITVSGAEFYHNAIIVEFAYSNFPFSIGDNITISGCANEGNNISTVIRGAIPLPDGAGGASLIIYTPNATFLESKETGEVTISLQALELNIKDLGVEIEIPDVKFSTSEIEFTLPLESEMSFVVGDSVTISGCALNDNNKTATIKDIKITYSSDVMMCRIIFGEDTFSESEDHTVTLTRAIPDLDYICESENRIWGCSNKDRTIYASALGDPTNFYNYEDGLSTCSYAVAVGSEGDFTGCCKLGSSVLFFKNNMLHKMLGSYPAEYTLYSYKMEGVAPGCHKSMQIINETLVYVSEHGVCSYTGSSSSMLSSALEGKIFTEAVGGSDGLRYYLSVKESGEYKLYTFDLKTGIWLHEDNTKVVDFARVGNVLYLLDSEGGVYLADYEEEDKEIEWMALFKPFYETTAGRKKHSQLLIRTELPSSSWMKVEVRFDGGRWREVGKIIGADARPFTVPINRCDKFEIRLSGVGPFVIMSMLRKFSVGGAV